MNSEGHILIVRYLGGRDVDLETMILSQCLCQPILQLSSPRIQSLVFRYPSRGAVEAAMWDVTRIRDDYRAYFWKLYLRVIPEEEYLEWHTLPEEDFQLTVLSGRRIPRRRNRKGAKA